MRRMGIGLGVGINRSNYAQGIFNAYNARVVADGGITEAGNCVNAVTGLLLNASLLIIPSGYKGGKAYAEIPTNGNGDLTWTRASDAWRTNADGLIQRVPWNLLQQSEDFTSGVWGKLSGTTVTANQTTAPNGTNTADLITEGTAVLLYYTTLTSAGTYTQSWYLKKGTGDIAAMYFGSGYSARYNLTLGTIVSTNNVTATITDVGNGWYRCTATATPTASFYAGLNYTNSSGLTIYAWGAQLVEGSSAQTYFPTTDRLNVPRLSYMYGSCPALLLEPQRTNLALYSQDFDNASWGKTRCSITANSVISPDGNTTADTLVEDTTATSTHRIVQSITLTAAAQTFSVYAKSANRDWIYLTLLQTANASAYFDLSNGTIGTVGSASTASIQSVGNGWYRCIMTATTAAGANTLSIYSASADNTISFTGSGDSAFYIWGAQLELGAYATTIIPTTTASATRIADTATKTGISSLIGQSEGTIYLNARYLASGTASGQWFKVYGTSNLISLALNGVQSVRTIINGLSDTITTSPKTDLGIKIAFRYNSSGVSLFINGTQYALPVGGGQTMTSLDSILFDASVNPQLQNAFINDFALFNTPLSDSDCTTITTL